MITVTIQVKPYLAAYLQSAYAHCTVEGAIRFTKNQNLYSCLLQLTTPRPKGVSPQCGERPEDLQLSGRGGREGSGAGNQL